MKKFLVALSIMALLLIAGPARADWIDDLSPIPSDMSYIGGSFSGDTGIITLKTKSGSCMKYKVINNKIIKMKKCSDTNWEDFIKE